ncbi:MAG TPA: T9SS type A sorting domain-containing protein, partial [Ignavibacteriaceae bacterium]|nr:T9SS type A sorting domain-containing protein [Ignavibacteriaceae bacterium]
WTNNGGLHNILADDNSFTSGSVSTSLWVFKHAFPNVGSFRYYCQEHGGPNGVGMAGVINVEAATGVNDEIFKLDYKLNQNYPNPFNPTTTIEYSIPQSSQVTLKVFNVTGSIEKVLISEFQPGGNYLVEFNSSDLASGVYFYQLSAGDFISTKRMILLK